MQTINDNKIVLKYLLKIYMRRFLTDSISISVKIGKSHQDFVWNQHVFTKNQDLFRIPSDESEDKTAALTYLSVESG